jgi:hypothetical protein
LLGALLFVGSPSRAITTLCQRRRNLGGKLDLILLLLLQLLRLLLDAVLMLQLTFFLSPPRGIQAAAAALSRRGSSRPGHGGCGVGGGTVVIIVILILILIAAAAAGGRACPGASPPQPPPPPTPSRCSPRWASSVHNAFFSAGMFVGTPIGLLLSLPLEAVRRSRGRDSRMAFLTAQLPAPFFALAS